MSDDIQIHNVILHILDNNMAFPVLSNSEIELDGEISEFLAKHLEKILGDSNLKNASFISEDNNMRDICAYFSEDAGCFMQASVELAGALFNIMLRNVDIPPADLICCLATIENRPHLAILKLNYKTGFTHFVRQEEEGSANTIIRHRTILPSEGQRIDECALVDLSDLSIRLLEKEYEINGEKEFYLSRYFLKCSAELSDNEKLKIINKVSKKINRKYFDEDFDKAAKLKKVIAESLEETSAVEVSAIAEEVFDNIPEIRDEYVSEIQKAGLTENTVAIPEKLVERKLRHHKIKTDTGIEINFPSNCYDDRDKIEFINNPDGTISIVIKNVMKITNK